MERPGRFRLQVCLVNYHSCIVFLLDSGLETGVLVIRHNELKASTRLPYFTFALPSYQPRHSA